MLSGLCVLSQNDIPQESSLIIQPKEYISVSDKNGNHVFTLLCKSHPNYSINNETNRKQVNVTYSIS